MHQFLKFILGIKLHVPDTSSVYRQEFFTVPTAMVCVIEICWQLASRMRLVRSSILILLANFISQATEWKIKSFKSARQRTYWTDTTKLCPCLPRRGSNDFNGISAIEHEIPIADARPIRRPQYRTPYALRQEMQAQVANMLDKDGIRPSNSPWSAPAILVPKKNPNGTPKYRFCVDFKALNSVTKFDT